MFKSRFRLTLAALLFACAGCAPVVGVDSKKRDDFTLQSSSLLILDFQPRPDNSDFMHDAVEELGACGIRADSMTVILMSGVSASRDIVQQAIKNKTDALQATHILEVVPAQETFNGYGQKISTDYMIELKDMKGEKQWVAKFGLIQTQEIVSAIVNPAPHKSFADALVGRMVKDGVLTHCPAKTEN